MIGRFFVRLWYLNRNCLLRKAEKIFSKCCKRKVDIIVEVPPERRAEVVNKDPVLKIAWRLYNTLRDVFQAIGADNASI